MHFQIIFGAILFFSFNSFLLTNCQTGGGGGNTNGNNCTRFFRSVRRAGLNMAGRLEIPMDEEFPKFQLRLKFSRAIHHLTVRQLKARDMGTHREFLIDPSEQQQDGLLRIDTFLRLQHLFGPAPRLTGVLYNNKVLCGDAVSDDSITVNLSTSTKRSVPILVVTSKLKDQEEDEEVFE